MARRPQTELVAEWILGYPTMARSRLFTASVHLATAFQAVNRLVGYLDGNQLRLQYVELGMKEIQSQLMKAVRALDMGDEVEPLGD